MNKLIFRRWAISICLVCIAQLSVVAQGNVSIKFLHTANDKPLVLQDSAYQKTFGEAYQLTKLKYYVSNAALLSKPAKPAQSVYLIDILGQDSLLLNVKPGTYTSLAFTLGVDSIYNCSGAQDGALDPLNGMFWSWNSGYVFFKLEGYSASSTADLQRIEHHIGGYLGAHNASAHVVLPLEKPLVVKENGAYHFEVTLNLDKYWKGKNELSIASNALIMAPGALAIKSAENLAGMFSIRLSE